MVLFYELYTQFNLFLSVQMSPFCDLYPMTGHDEFTVGRVAPRRTSWIILTLETRPGEGTK